MNSKGDRPNDQTSRMGGIPYPIRLLSGAVAVSVFVAGLAVFGSGKFGWAAGALLLSYGLYRSGLPRRVLPG